MLITTLVENTTISKAYKNKHGLSLYIKTKSRNILFDLGPDDTFLKNAEKLNISIKDVDIVIISHGHKDHGGGLETFLKHNDKAKIYISKYAFDNYYASLLKYIKLYVGLNQNLKANNRIILTDEVYKINDDMILVSNVKGDLLVPRGNKSLLKKEGESFIGDNFSHEQHLILNSEGKRVLISGCSHSGILNILQEAEKMTGEKLNFIIGGLHLFNPINRRTEKLDFVKELGDELSQKNIKIYTCHCTGDKAFKELKNRLCSNIDTLKTGQVLELLNENFFNKL